MVRREIEPRLEQGLRAEVKRQLRRRMQGLRRVLPAEARDARSAAICERLQALPAFDRARVVIAYRATSREADPHAAVAVAQQNGKVVGLPRVLADGSLELRAYQSGDALERGAFGIDEPSEQASVLSDGSVDLIIVPALAFDDRGHRIGYGQGYYDRLLPRLPNAYKVVIGYDFQRIVEAPDLPGDVPVDAIVTDLRSVVVAEPR